MIYNRRSGSTGSVTQVSFDHQPTTDEISIFLNYLQSEIEEAGPLPIGGGNTLDPAGDGNSVSIVQDGAGGSQIGE